MTNATTPNDSQPSICSIREVLVFTLCSVACMLIVFGSAFWSGSILAPLDIPPAFYTKYHWVDESQGPVPANHYIIDIFDHELPRQYSIYTAIQHGEFPWWDPYTDCGRPLIAEAHISGTDIPRLLLYKCLPFVPAYNLSKLLHSFLLGLGAFFLLRHWSHRFMLAVFGGLAFQFAGAFALFQTPLCVLASAVWYPWIWLAWSFYLRNRKWFCIGAGVSFCALSIAAGNQQTHAFLAVFAACFVLGNLWHDRKSLKPALIATFISPLLGALIVLPLLIPQVELSLLCNRTPALAEFSKIRLLTGAASLTGFFPWALGTFRTIDVSKMFGEAGLGFSLFIGSVAFILAVMGACRVFTRARRTAEGSVAVMLVLFYLFVCSTPLVAIFYTRLAGLAVLGLIVLAMQGAGDILSGTLSPWQKRSARLLVAGLLAIMLCCNIFSFLTYPKIRDRVEMHLLERDLNKTALDTAPELRRFQARNLPREISVLNPETILSLAGAIALLVALRARNTISRSRWFLLAMLLNLAPELSFAWRFTSRSPVAHWQSLLAGGPEQQGASHTLDGGLRLRETTRGRFDLLFPGALAHLYRAHMVRGYSSFPLTDVSAEWNRRFPNTPFQDFTYPGNQGSFSSNQLENTASRSTPSRFQWEPSCDRKVRILSETLNSITVEVEDGPPGVLWRTDRYYPGWELLDQKAGITGTVEGVFLKVSVPPGQQVLVFHYRPRLLTAACWVSAGALVSLTALLVIVAVRRK